MRNVLVDHGVRANLDVRTPYAILLLRRLNHFIEWAHFALMYPQRQSIIRAK
jgi:hypothetical protein